MPGAKHTIGTCRDRRESRQNEGGKRLVGVRFLFDPYIGLRNRSILNLTDSKSLAFSLGTLGQRFFTFDMAPCSQIITFADVKVHELGEIEWPKR